MCEYAEYNNKNQLICKPYKSLCLFCVMGNGRRYKNIQEHLENVYTEAFEDEDLGRSLAYDGAMNIVKEEGGIYEED